MGLLDSRRSRGGAALEEFRALPSEEVTTDIHCVTKWSKLGTTWEGVSPDTLLRDCALTREEIVRYLAFHLMVRRGISNEEMARRIRLWQR